MDLTCKNGSRKGILTIQNRKHLQSKNINDKILNKITHALEDRLDALLDDLEIIAKSKHLEVWRNYYKMDIVRIIRLMDDMQFEYKPMYIYLIKKYKKKIGKRKLDVFWIDDSVESDIRRPKIFEPSFALRQIRNRIGKETEKILLEAIKHDLIPNLKKNAISEESLERLLRR